MSIRSRNPHLMNSRVVAFQPRIIPTLLRHHLGPSLIPSKRLCAPLYTSHHSNSISRAFSTSKAAKMPQMPKNIVKGGKEELKVSVKQNCPANMRILTSRLVNCSSRMPSYFSKKHTSTDHGPMQPMEPLLKYSIKLLKQN